MLAHQHLALVLLGRWVDVCNHGCSVGHKDSVHQTPGHHADHDDPHLNIICRTRHRPEIRCDIFISGREYIGAYF